MADKLEQDMNKNKNKEGKIHTKNEQNSENISRHEN